MERPRPWTACLVAPVMGLVVACSGDRGPDAPRPVPGSDPGWSPSARPDIVELLRDDLETARHPSDGAGRAWLVAGHEVVAGAAGRFEVELEAGPDGIAEGGAVLLQPSSFWGWSTPQAMAPEMPGYTTATTGADGVGLDLATLDRQLLAIRVTGRRLAPGERIRIVYGASGAGAVADRYAEHGERIWVAVDGDGDGVRAVLPDSPEVDVVAGPAAGLVAHLPSVVRPGETVSLRLAVLDAAANAGVSFEGRLELTVPDGLDGPRSVRVGQGDGGLATVVLTAGEPGVYRVLVVGPDGFEAVTNPMQVSSSAPRLLWADLHGHTRLSDGTGTPADYLGYARDVAALDVIAVTDHDHWGVRPLDRTPELWRRTADAVERFHQPGRFVALTGFEWTSWLYGHRHVLYFDGGGEVVSSLDPATDEPAELWSALAGTGALTVAHHPAGGPVATAWQHAPDPAFEPVVEVASVHGASEAADAPAPIYDAVDGAWVRDALGRGYRLGFVGSGDSHDGHPGLAHLQAGQGGLAALVGADHTRESVRRALVERRCYATNGPRIILRAALDGRPMGSDVPVPDGPVTVVATAVGTAEIRSVDLVRGADVVASVAGDGGATAVAEWRLHDLESGEFVYVRAIQADGGAAWSSPFFLR